MESVIWISFMAICFEPLLYLLGQARRLFEAIIRWKNRSVEANKAASTDKSSKIRDELMALRRAMQGINAQDDFAEWTKLQRRFAQLQKQQQEMQKSQAASDAMSSMIKKWIPYVLQMFLLQFAIPMVLWLFYRRSPVLYLPTTEQLLPWKAARDAWPLTAFMWWLINRRAARAIRKTIS